MMIDKYMNIDFIGSAYKTKNKEETIENKKDILMKYNEYQLRKLEFLDEAYDNERTKITYWTIYNTNLMQYEVLKNKDLMSFTTEEISNLLSSIIYSYNTTRQNLSSFLNVYFRWCKKRGDIMLNQITNISIPDVTENSKVFLENKIYNKEDFWTMIKYMEEKTKLPNLIPLILARYGIIGSKLSCMINLKWGHIDYEKRIVNIDNNGIIRQLPVDDIFLEYIDKARLYSENVDGKKVAYTNNGYVLKKSKNDKEDKDSVIKYSSVFNRVNDACRSINIPRIPFKVLLLSRQLEMLVSKRKYGRLTSNDIKEIVLLYDLDTDEVSINKTHALKNRYEVLSGDTVITNRKDTRISEDKAHIDVYKNIIEQTGLSI